MIALNTSRRSSVARPNYEPGTNVPAVGSVLELTFVSRYNSKRSCDSWVSEVSTLEGRTLFVLDDKSVHMPTEEQTRWTVTVSRAPIADQPDKHDPVSYHRIIAVIANAPVLSKKAQKRALKVHQAPVPTVSQVKIEAPKKRRLNAIAFLWSGVSWTWRFEQADGKVEMFVLTNPPAELLRMRYKHLAGAYSVPLDVEVEREIEKVGSTTKYEVAVVATHS